MPLILRCPGEICAERTRLRHDADPAYHDPPEVYDEPKHARIWAYLAQLGRADLGFVDASRALDEVYEAVKARVLRLTAPGA